MTKSQDISVLNDGKTEKVKKLKTSSIKNGRKHKRGHKIQSPHLMKF